MATKLSLLNTIQAYIFILYPKFTQVGNIKKWHVPPLLL